MRFAVRLEAGPWERFAPGAFDASIGSTGPLLPEETGAGCSIRLARAEVAGDGTSVLLTYEITGCPGDPVTDQIAAGQLSPMSFRLPPQ